MSSDILLPETSRNSRRMAFSRHFSGIIDHVSSVGSTPSEYIDGTDDGPMPSRGFGGPSMSEGGKRSAGLTANSVKHARPREKAYKLSDRDGLYLLVFSAIALAATVIFWL